MDASDVKYYMKALARGASYIFALFASSFAMLGLYGMIAPGIPFLTRFIGTIICGTMMACFYVSVILLHAFAVKPEKEIKYEA